jgi:hypothetical protein
LQLTLTYNRTRQASITTELIEIISGEKKKKNEGGWCWKLNFFVFFSFFFFLFFFFRPPAYYSTNQPILLLPFLPLLQVPPPWRVEEPVEEETHSPTSQDHSRGSGSKRAGRRRRPAGARSKALAGGALLLGCFFCLSVRKGFKGTKMRGRGGGIKLGAAC